MPTDIIIRYGKIDRPNETYYVAVPEELIESVLEAIASIGTTTNPAGPPTTPAERVDAILAARIPGGSHRRRPEPA